MGIKELFGIMAPKHNEPIRMCIACRTRIEQKSLFRLQCNKEGLSRFDGNGRSFYLCENCLEGKQTARALARQCKRGDIENLLIQLKEIVADGRQSKSA
jgi:predicted RNA-binding protein YlxR (DUF448 family)